MESGDPNHCFTQLWTKRLILRRLTYIQMALDQSEKGKLMVDMVDG